MKLKINEERRKAEPEASDLQSAEAVWEHGEVVPSVEPRPRPKTGALGRVADAGDIGSGTPSTYGAEVQAEVVGTYTGQRELPPKKGKAP